MTGSDIAKSARALLSDADKKRWSTTDFLKWINEWQRLTVRLRPSLKISTAGTLRTIADITAMGGTLAIPKDFLGDAVDYVVARANEQQAGDKENQRRAEFHVKQFGSTVKT